MKKFGSPGLIIVGYQGIGKSSVCQVSRESDGIIDFESSLLKVDGFRAADWYVIYCRQAVALAKQGYTVLISSHECVRTELAKYDQDGFNVVIIMPHYSLQNKWISKLHDRYLNEPSDANYAAWKNAEEKFAQNICELASDPNFGHIFIMDMHYHLYSMLRNLKLIYSTRGYYDKYGDKSCENRSIIE